MGAREEILAAVAAAFGAEPRPEVAVPRDYRRSGPTDATRADATRADATETDATETDATETDATETDATETDAMRAEVIALFARRVQDYRATVTRCRAGELGAAVATAVQGAGPVIVPAELGVDVPGATVDSGATAAALDAFGAVVTTAAVAIAETGTVILDHGPGQGRRALSLVPDRHVCIVGEDQVVAGVVQAIERLDPARPQTWISGPSATSDIELSRVEGVHGPRTLKVLLVRP
jgi:L-lactate dehydrogenase complex protein LldG